MSNNTFRSGKLNLSESSRSDSRSHSSRLAKSPKSPQLAEKAKDLFGIQKFEMKCFSPIKINSPRKCEITSRTKANNADLNHEEKLARQSSRLVGSFPTQGSDGKSKVTHSTNFLPSRRNVLTKNINFSPVLGSYRSNNKFSQTSFMRSKTRNLFKNTELGSTGGSRESTNDPFVSYNKMITI